MNSIRRTLMFWLLGGLWALITAGGVALFWGVRVALTREFDETLASRAAGLVSSIRWDGVKVDLEYITEAMPWYTASAAPEFFVLRDAHAGDTAGGAALAKSASLGDNEWPPGESEAPGSTNAPLPDGRAGRILQVMFRPLPDEELDDPTRAQARRAAVATAPNLVLRVGKGREELDRTLTVLGASLGGVGVAMSIGVLALVRAALKRGLHPLERLSALVQEIDAETLSQRLTTQATPIELHPIYSRLNDLLIRLEHAFERERRFTVAAAHELRTPLAELRSILEVSLSRQRSVAEATGSLGESLTITLQMARLVDGLFWLARHESAPEQPELEPVDLAPLLTRLRDKHDAASAARGGRVRLEAPDLVAVNANPALLELVLDNVLANAVIHADPFPQVVCEVLCAADAPPRVTVRVTNPVQGLSSAEVACFFEPFWRRSVSRSDRSHLGLGLTLARKSAEAMGGVLSAELTEGGQQIVVRLDMPRSAQVDRSMPRFALQPSRHEAPLYVGPIK